MLSLKVLSYVTLLIGFLQRAPSLVQEALQMRDEKVLFDVTAASMAAGERLFIWYHIHS